MPARGGAGASGLPDLGSGPPGAPAFYPGLKLDRYELLCPLAQGGMGAVWLARYVGKFGFSRLVVVKVILPELARETAMRTMFIDEARIAGGIDHPHVVSTIDVGEDKGTVFMVMDWVDGDSLSRLVKQVRQSGERMPAGIVLKVAHDISQGLHAAHELREPSGELLGVIHRDVSPQNVLLAVDGRAMLIDFGIAKANKRMTAATAVGRIKGKVGYMSPEQARGTGLDRRADIFSVGAMLYELFSGAPPFEKESDVATLTRLMRGGPADPLPQTVPKPVQNVVMHALELDPNRRFQTAAELGDALANAMHEIGAGTTESEVGRYANEFLSARRTTRRRTVESALAARAAVVAEPLAPARPMRMDTAVTLEGDASPFAAGLGEDDLVDDDEALSALGALPMDPTEVAPTRRADLHAGHAGQAGQPRQPRIMWPTQRPVAPRAAGTPWALLAVVASATAALFIGTFVVFKLMHDAAPVATNPLPVMTIPDSQIPPQQQPPQTQPPQTVATQPTQQALPTPPPTARPPVVEITTVPHGGPEPTATWTVRTMPTASNKPRR